MAGFLGGYLMGSLLGLLASLAVLEMGAARVRREKARARGFLAVLRGRGRA